MNPRIKTIIRMLPLLAVCTPVFGVRIQKPDQFKDAFFKWMEEKADLDKEQREHLEHVRESVPEQTPAVEVVVEGLRAVYAPFSHALADLNSEEPQATIEKLKPLADSANPFLGHAARHFVGRAHMMREDYEAALEQFGPVAESDGPRNPFRAEALYQTAVARLKMVEPVPAREALETLAEIGGQYGVSPERQRQLQQAMMSLAMMEQAAIMEAMQLMDDSRRRLKLERVGETTQERQERIVAILDEIIEAAEEGGGGGGGGGGGQSQGGASQGGSASGSPSGVQSSTPASQSSLPGGAASMGELGRSTRGRPGESWGSMPPNEREKVLSAIQEKFPNRYRELIEQYYKGLQESGSR